MRSVGVALAAIGIVAATVANVRAGLGGVRAGDAEKRRFFEQQWNQYTLLIQRGHLVVERDAVIREVGRNSISVQVGERAEVLPYGQIRGAQDAAGRALAFVVIRYVPL